MSVNSPITASHRLFQGEDRNIEFTVTDSAGAPQNCFSFTLAFFVFESSSRGTKLLDISAGAITLFDVNGTNDGIRVAIADTDTIAAIVPPALVGEIIIPAGTYWYELWRVDEGYEHPLATGDFTLRSAGRRQEVT